MAIGRELNLASLLDRKPFFLFGPRATGKKAAIDVKTTTKASRGDLKGLRFLQEEGVFKQFILVSQDPVVTRNDSILSLPWQMFLEDLWQDRFV